jgi:hypothetical protein
VLLLRAWLGIVGFTYRHAQLLPLIASLFGAPAFFLMAVRMKLRYPAALLGAAMLLASPTLVSYATRVKQYQFDVPLAIIVIGLAAAVLRDPASTRPWVLLSIASVTALAVSFALVGVVFAGFAAANVAFWRTAVSDQPRRSPSALCSWAVAAFLAVWYLGVIRPALSPALREFWSGYYLSEAHGVANRPPFWHWIDTADHGLLGHDWMLVQSLFRGAFSGSAVVLLIAFLAASVLVAIRRPLDALLFGLPVVVMVAAAVVQVAPFGGGRTDAWLYAPMTFMLASGADVVLAWVRGRVAGWVAGGSVVALAIVSMLSIPSPAAFSWPDVGPLVAEMEAARAPDDLVVVNGTLAFNYALSAPQSFTTRVSDRNATHFSPVVDHVNSMTWMDYPAPMAEFHKQLTDVRDVWLLDTPEIIYPLGAPPRTELAHRGFSVVTQSRSGGAVLEHWRRASP